MEALQAVLSNITFQNERVENVLLPVYKLDYDYQGKKYPIYMNGQTGEVAGIRPVSIVKRFVMFFILLILMATIVRFGMGIYLMGVAG